MKILFQMRRDYASNPAGDSIQMLSTARELRNLGVNVDISSIPHVNLADYDLIHIFGLTNARETVNFLHNAKLQQKKVVLSPIYWDMIPYIKGSQMSSGKLAGWNYTNQIRATVLKQSDLILPNGKAEAALLKNQFIFDTPYTVVPNGFPDYFIEVKPSIFRTHFPDLPEDFVLSVARISSRKNQLWLAQVCQELGLPLILIGPINEQEYFKKVSDYSKVTYLGILNGELLASAYAASRVHALPSWFETPGLASLEAAACGTVVLTTDQGSVRDYFGDMAVYVHPKDDTSLKSGLLQAWNWNSKPLTDYVRAHFPWSRIGKLTLDAYLTDFKS